MRRYFLLFVFVVFSCAEEKTDFRLSKGKIIGIRHRHHGYMNYTSYYTIESTCSDKTLFIHEKNGSGGPLGGYFKRGDSVCFVYDNLLVSEESEYIKVKSAKVFYSVNPRNSYVFYKKDKSDRCKCYRKVVYK